MFIINLMPVTKSYLETSLCSGVGTVG